jgi:hypothetical protein
VGKVANLDISTSLWAQNVMKTTKKSLKSPDSSDIAHITGQFCWPLIFPFLAIWPPFLATFLVFGRKPPTRFFHKWADGQLVASDFSLPATTF